MIHLLRREHAGSYLYQDFKSGDLFVVEKIDDIRGPSYAYWWWRRAEKSHGDTSYPTKRAAVEALEWWIRR